MTQCLNRSSTTQSSEVCHTSMDQLFDVFYENVCWSVLCEKKSTHKVICLVRRLGSNCWIHMNPFNNLFLYFLMFVCFGCVDFHWIDQKNDRILKITSFVKTNLRVWNGMISFLHELSLSIWTHAYFKIYLDS